MNNMQKRNISYVKACLNSDEKELISMFNAIELHVWLVMKKLFLISQMKSDVIAEFSLDVPALAKSVNISPEECLDVLKSVEAKASSITMGPTQRKVISQYIDTARR